MDPPRTDSPPPNQWSTFIDACEHDDAPWLPRPTMQPFDPEVHYLSPWMRVELRNMRSIRMKDHVWFPRDNLDSSQMFNLILNRRKLADTVRVNYTGRKHKILKEVSFHPSAEISSRRRGEGTPPVNPSRRQDEETFTFRLLPSEIEKEDLVSISVNVFVDLYHDHHISKGAALCCMIIRFI